MVGEMGAIILLIGLGLYFLPSIVALIKDKKQGGAICILNLFLGWTFVGWVVALVMALWED